MDEIETSLWRDGHLHLRVPPTLQKLAPWTDLWCSDAVVEPNTTPRELETAEDIQWYEAICKESLSQCQVLTTMYLTPKTTPAMVHQAHKAGCNIIKVYPAEQTTNSQKGITREMYKAPPDLMLGVYEAAQDLEMVIQHHGELPGEFIMDQEHKFAPVFERLVRLFPKLRMTLEHVSDRAGVHMVQWLHDDGFPVAGTITWHHLWMKEGLNDVMRPKMKPDWVCMPIAKRPEDHRALVGAIRHKAFFSGTDSAFHPPESKYAFECCAGCWTSPTPEMLVHLLEEYEMLDLLVPFAVERMGAFYGLGEPRGKLRFLREEWTVPGQFDGMVPFLAGKKLNWRLEGRP